MMHKDWVLCFVLFAVISFAMMRGASGDESIGRVFMTSEERQLLDRLRKQPDAQPGVESNAETNFDTSRNEDMRQPTGFIVGPNGKPYQWLDGDFRAVEAKAFDVRQLQGLVPITSHLESDRDRNTDESHIERTDEGRPGESVADSGSKDDVQP